MRTACVRIIVMLLGMVMIIGEAVPQAVTERESDPLVLKKLEWFQDQKFGLLMHWGPYSQWGVVESWSLCSEDEPWCQRSMENYVEYCQKYERLKDTFNPVRFDPDAWASVAKRAGMKYVVFTTKHHDGFCMFDTRETDYRITDKGCPFHADARANVARQIFDAFRRQSFGVGAYFSKPDWHSPFYWSRYWATPDRNVNYSIAKHPDLWRKFREFTHRQIDELMSGYGPIDILWLDGGWVNPGNRGQDIDIPTLAANARKRQPGLIVVDRAVGGRYENYRTPEQEVPERPLDGPWETCMTMGDSWSYVPDDHYKPARKLVHLLVDVVAKGGNFLLNVGPSPEGELPPVAVSRLKEIGAWMDVNRDGIYGTRPVAPYREGKVCFTRRQGGAVYAVYLADEKEQTVPAVFWLQGIRPRPGTAVRMLGVREDLRWENSGRGVAVFVPEGVQGNPPCDYAWTLEIREPEGL